MFSLCTIFEEWFIDDGGYPPLKKGQKVNLSFEMFLHNFEIVGEEVFTFDQIKNAEYSFSGRVIYKHAHIIIIDTLSFKFYIETDRYNIGHISEGQFLKGNGDIHMDSYVWVLCLESYKNHPNIFYNLVVENIFEVTISKNYIVSVGNTVRFPCSLRNDKYSDNDVKEVNRIGSDEGLVFYLLNLKEINETVEKTYHNKKLFRQYRIRRKVIKFLRIFSMENIKDKIDKIIGLYKWNRLKKLPDSYINDIFRSSDFKDIVIALIHSDQKTLDKFLNCSKLFDKEKELKYAAEQFKKGWIPPKYISDEKKVHLVNISTKVSDTRPCDKVEVN
jgi:hypothetical protein